MREYRTFWAVLLVVAFLTPVGIYLPQLLKAGSAWGEWGLKEIRSMVGYAPRGMEKATDAWKAPMPAYAPPGEKDSSPGRKSAYYVLSAVLGVVLCGAAGWLFARWVSARSRKP